MSPFKHLSSYRLLYFLLPLMLFAILAAFRWVPALDHRAPIDDAGALIGWAQSACLFALILAFADVAKPHLFDDIDTRALAKEGLELVRSGSLATRWDALFILLFIAWRITWDTLETIFLILAGFYIFGVFSFH